MRILKLISGMVCRMLGRRTPDKYCPTAEKLLVKAAVINNIVLFGDGQTPGEIIWNTEKHVPDTLLHILNDFMASRTFAGASEDVKDAFRKYKRLVVEGLRRQSPQPHDWPLCNKCESILEPTGGTCWCCTPAIPHRGCPKCPIEASIDMGGTFLTDHDISRQIDMMEMMYPAIWLKGAYAAPGVVNGMIMFSNEQGRHSLTCDGETVGIEENILQIVRGGMVTIKRYCGAAAGECLLELEWKGRAATISFSNVGEA